MEAKREIPPSGLTPFLELGPILVRALLIFPWEMEIPRIPLVVPSPLFKYLRRDVQIEAPRTVTITIATAGRQAPPTALVLQWRSISAGSSSGQWRWASS
ncbi:hypothetical protein TIFTF001_023081 [Ficus carica]|uniref:Uncharacterized protein n=1 Tax=Ficus carica TaxID=3494 RepID=A0AA88AIY5_FICCA|nr:hypothetical protein TIFTF001_023081 [Ficus carica]